MAVAGSSTWSSVSGVTVVVVVLTVGGDAVVVGDGLSVFFQHHKGVQYHAAVGGDDPGIHDGQPELVQGRGGVGKQGIRVPGVDEDLRATAVGELSDQHQG